MAPSLPGSKIWENTIPLTTAASPLLTGWYETTGFTSLLLNCVFTTGTTTFTIEGSFDGVNLDATMPYTPAVTASSGVGGTVFVVQHTYVRFRVIQTISNATVTTIYIQARA
jgi:hypothetical protein